MTRLRSRPQRARHAGRLLTLGLTGALLAAHLAATPASAAPAPPAAGPVGHDLGTATAHWIDRTTVTWPRPAHDAHTYDIVHSTDASIRVDDGRLTGDFQTIPLRPAPDGLTDEQRAQWPHLATRTALRIGADGHRGDTSGRLADALRGQVAVVERDRDGRVIAATGAQIPGVLDDLYAAAADAALGPAWTDGRPTLSVWAPTARTVRLVLYDGPRSADSRTVRMKRDDGTGVWSAHGPTAWNGKYYAFEVEVYAPTTAEIVTDTVTDPYSLALAADSQRSLIADPADPALAPDGWEETAKPAPVPLHAATIYELHVRDFSASDTTVPETDRGTYRAFTDPGDRPTAGMAELRSLAEDGVDHVHLLPAYDFGSVPERRSDQKTPACDLESFPADSAEQQACIERTAHADAFNWGYDPVHTTVPQGSYAGDPDGTTRITEFREMVMGLNRAGLRVVMDVVYNHTYATGQDSMSVLDRVVPGYYHRLLDDGSVAESTCCPNTAPEHTMMGRLVVDSVVTWAREYKVDGFRFDLMGHHPKANMLAVRAALDDLTPERDGVDGSAIVLYGEGWDFGEVAGGARFEQATQLTMAGTGIGTFNDRLRDGVRGGGPFDADPRLQGFGSGLFTDPNTAPGNGDPGHQRARLLHYQDLIKVGLTGNLRDYRFTASSGREVTGREVDYNGAPAGYTAHPGESVTYVDAHDNETLYDALAYKLPPGTPMEQRVRMQSLALGTALLGQGGAFVHAGSERLRSKSLDRNSYDSGDWFNRLHWDCADGNNFGVGLPRARDNEDKWPYARPLLADPALRADCAAIENSRARFGELLRIRASSPVFTLGSAEQVQRRVSFPLSGPQETPGVITMRLDATDVDPRWSSVTVVFNASPHVRTQTVEALRGADTALHPVQAESDDPVVGESSVDPETGTLTVPGRTVAVFVEH
ncbi:pullulanase-type alpha-1,6-glucosidase [Nocardiopsis mwathae]|uniref:Pullulanase-type alpha-1,6-glucosidase n=1 Tax=Nocardiopsis mwathae TaxID=1472723 RepID=A0A7X0D4F0_9ACTN|nr:pullulanase-type alpha-1,6-glucosidase [Nocardiopsis mwathae]MBB6169999.1 pullulanase-type alpha-1,6-glucosidase [Nocardiopsis mwathae]